MSTTKRVIASVVEGIPVNPMSNDPEAVKLRIKSMMSYEGYLEYYKCYSNWERSQGRTPQPVIDKKFFNSRMASMDLSLRKQIARIAFEFGVDVPKGFV